LLGGRHPTTTKLAMSTFQPTRWSLIQQAAAPPDTLSRDRAWSEFDALYRSPLIGFARRKGWGEGEAEDHIQTFLAKLADRDWLAEAAPDRGKMRTFLLARLHKHLGDARKFANAQKRGGGAEPVELDQQLLADDSAEPDVEEFDREWARAILRRVLDRLRAEAKASGKTEFYELLRSQLTGEGDGGVRETAIALGKSEGAVRVALHRFRDRFRELMRAEVEQTLLPGEDVVEEMGYLARVLREA
ncbi:MAG: DNA-directed RNA polymerase specialized sigma24 family protein, partial [Verrucomicrobiales bacterium]